MEKQKDLRYLTNKGEYKIVDGDIPVQSQRKANQQYQMVHKDRGNPATI